MKADDPRILHRTLHGQDVLVPSVDAWLAIALGEELEGIPVQLTDWVAAWLREYSRFDELFLGVTLLHGRWLLIPLLRKDEHWYRVHLEDVICDHCDWRCGPSATPDTTAYAGTEYTVEQIFAEFTKLGIQRCPHCTGLLVRRQTAWLGAAV